MKEQQLKGTNQIQGNHRECLLYLCCEKRIYSGLNLLLCSFTSCCLSFQPLTLCHGKVCQ